MKGHMPDTDAADADPEAGVNGLEKGVTDHDGGNPDEIANSDDTYHEIPWTSIASTGDKTRRMIRRRRSGTTS